MLECRLVNNEWKEKGNMHDGTNEIKNKWARKYKHERNDSERMHNGTNITIGQ